MYSNSDNDLPTSTAAKEQELPYVEKMSSSIDNWLRHLKGYKRIQKTEFTIQTSETTGSDKSSSEIKITMLDVALSTDAEYFDRTNLLPIEPNKKYIVSTEVAGIIGELRCAFFGVSLFDKKNVFLGRRVQWLNDFTGMMKKYNVIFKTPDDAVTLRIIYRINTEAPNRSFCEYKLLPLEQIKLLPADPKSEESYDAIENVDMPSQGKTNDNQLIVIYTVKAEVEAARGAQKLVFPKTTAPKVSIIVLNYNKGEYTFNCLSSVLRNTEPGTYEVILVDNGSTEEESKAILKKLENVKILTPPENLGFIKGNNHASKHANGKYLLFMNNDTIVLKGWLEALLRTFERDEKVGVVGSKFIYPNGTLQEAGSMIWKDGSARGYGRNASDPSKPEYQFVREVDFCSGASLIVRKDLFDEVGGFNEFYVPAYFEDVDLCFAARKRGYKTMYNPFSVVVHYEGVTSTRDVHNPNGVKRFEIENRPKFVSLWKDELEKRLPALDANVLYARDLKKGPCVLVVDGWVPEPDKSSGDLRSYNITRILSQLGCKVTLLVSNFRESKYANDLRELGIEVVPSSYMSIDRLLKERPGYYSLAVINTNRMTTIDLKHCFFQVKINEVGIKIALHIDDLYGYSKIIKKAVTKDESDVREDHEVTKLLTDHSMDMIDSSDFVFVISDGEKRIINNLAKSEKAIVIPEMRHPISQKNTTDFKQRNNAMLYVGGFSHKPNIASASLLIYAIFPKVKAKIPDAKLYVVGNVPPAEFTNLKDESIVVTGFVEDLAQYYNIAKVSACPIVAKGGVKGKIIEALNYHTPVVTSPMGIEGTELVDGQDILVAKDSDQFADKIVELLNSQTLWDKLSKGGRKYFEDHNSTSSAEAILNELLQKIKDSLSNLGAADAIAKKYHVEPPLAVLLLVYNQRIDLQETFPEVKNGEYNRLIEWAVKYGATIDSQERILFPYKDWFMEQLKS